MVGIRAYSWIKDTGLANLSRSSPCRGAIVRPYLGGENYDGYFLLTLSTPIYTGISEEALSFSDRSEARVLGRAVPLSVTHIHFRFLSSSHHLWLLTTFHIP